MIHWLKKVPTLAIWLLSGGTALAVEAALGVTLLEEVVVTAEFRPVSILDTSSSISLIDARSIEEHSATHLESLLNLAPNVNFSTGASRGRFFQIRGIGERSQFVEPINPSVGLVMDGMDFTGIGGVATTLDLAQVEVFRGPQGTLFGANALAGMIHLVSRAPEHEFGARAGLILGNENLQTVEAAVTAPLSDTLSARLAIQSNQSDGWIDNVFLHHPTNDIDELTARGRLAWQVNDALDLDFTLFLADMANGYDAFSLDNTRETLSDQPGQDALEVVAGSLNAAWTLASGRRLEALFSHVNADSVYRYDEDWSYRGICDGTPCDSALWGFDWWYSSVDAYERRNDNSTVDIRLLSDTDGTLRWVTGLYFRDQVQGLRRDYTFNPGEFVSQYDTQNLAAYGQLDFDLDARWTLVTGLRGETRDWDYTDNSAAPADGDGETFWGGRLALELRPRAGLLVYALVSRGYKPGGYNSALASQLPDLETQGFEVPEGALVFGGETLWNYEAGLKADYLNGAVQLALSVFQQERDDVQAKQSLVIPLDPDSDLCPCEFVDSVQNAAGGVNRGVEVELGWQLTGAVHLYGALGLLDAEYRDYESFAHSEADPESGTPFDLSGRDQAHAPNWQYVLGAYWNVTEHWILNLEAEGKDAFFASPNHQVRTDDYTLFNARLAWSQGPWVVALWGRNLSDEVVQTRGFGGFGNDPRKFYAEEPYFQLGAPRTWGISITWEG